MLFLKQILWFWFLKCEGLLCVFVFECLWAFWTVEDVTLNYWTLWWTFSVFSDILKPKWTCPLYWSIDRQVDKLHNLFPSCLPAEGKSINNFPGKKRHKAFVCPFLLECLTKLCVVLAVCWMKTWGFCKAVTSSSKASLLNTFLLKNVW